MATSLIRQTKLDGHNRRFKSILSPFEDKGLGEFFEPINTKPMTRIGLVSINALKG